MKRYRKGLAWTSVGGELIPVEVALDVPKIELAGSLGDNEGIGENHNQFVRSRTDELKIEHDFCKTKDIHIHVPEGAVPKAVLQQAFCSRHYLWLTKIPPQYRDDR